jgi:hypothetical protein
MRQLMLPLLIPRQSLVRLLKKGLSLIEMPEKHRSGARVDSKVHFSQQVRKARIGGLAASRRVWRPSVQPVWRPALL